MEVYATNVFVHAFIAPNQSSTRFVSPPDNGSCFAFLRRGHGQSSQEPSELDTMQEADRRPLVHLTYYAMNGTASRTDRGPPRPTGRYAMQHTRVALAVWVSPRHTHKVRKLRLDRRGRRVIGFIRPPHAVAWSVDGSIDPLAAAASAKVFLVSTLGE
jgi:hypothetical protein